MTEKNETLLEVKINKNGKVGLNVRITDKKQFDTVMINLAGVAAQILDGKRKESYAFVISLIRGLNLQFKELLYLDLKAIEKTENKGDAND